MKILKINFKNCYGINSLQHEFQFGGGTGNKSVAIYAPNGLMKTSFTRTFEKLSQGEAGTEERYNRISTSEVSVDGAPIVKESIYILKSEIDIREDSAAITDILVNPASKARYDEILVDLEKQKLKLLATLQKASGIPKKDVEKTLRDDFEGREFAECLLILRERPEAGATSHLSYSTLFDPKVVEIIKSPEFVSGAKEFHSRYQELFDQEGTIYQKGIFNPLGAETSLNTLEKQGFFSGGHRVQMRGNVAAIGRDELEALLKKIHSKIDNDEKLKKIRTSLAKNAQTQALAELIEGLPAGQVDELVERLKPENQSEFRRDIWNHYLKNIPDVVAFLDLYESTKNEINAIEAEAEKDAPRWTQAVALFNDRFVDMPFTLSVANQAMAALGVERARLKFTFKDGEDVVEWSRAEIKTLSQGEKRALYLLNFIFEVEARSQTSQEALFVIDDVADSFDYKNKHAIVQYLKDLDSRPKFFQIILTHNFDFFRTVADSFVSRDRCLMANRGAAGISLTKAEGIKNYLTGILKEKVHTSPRMMCASIPFARNLIEYTKGTTHPSYLKLTSLLHWKKDTDSITTQDYFDIYNDLFGSTHLGAAHTVKTLLYKEAKSISNAVNYPGLNLEDKILLSMAIRMRAEEYLIGRIRELTKDASYWCETGSQFGELMKKYSALQANPSALRTLEKVSVTVSSNIHLNSFMYEPILDLTINHLARLYKEVDGLIPEPVAATQEAASK